ncbi:MAG: polysaccharide biosynthesis C-terminal domain-containing protein [Deltaproteobacteria bacterium]|nr:polysaccharide biosynthesis C-terminal domain-containing protein [Deltaproteobacteria bacterium]
MNQTRGDLKRNSDIEGAVFYGTLYIALMVSAGSAIYSLKQGLTIEMKAGLLAMSAIVILTWYYEYYLAILKSYQRFPLITSANYLDATVNVGLTVLLIYFFGIYGLYASAMLSLMVVISYFRSSHPLNHTAGFKFNIFTGLVKNGFPILLFGLGSLLMHTADRLVVSWFLGLEALGYYGIAVMVMNAIMDIPIAARDVMEPRLMQSIEAEKKDEILRDFLFKPLINTAYLMPFLVGTVVFLMPAFVTLLLPRYIQGIGPTQIVVFGAYFFSMSYVLRGMIIARGLQLKGTLIMAVSIIINIALSVVFIKTGYGLNGVAGAGVVSFLVLFISLFLFVRKNLDCPDKQWQDCLKAISLPFPIMCASILAISFAMAGLNPYLKAVLGYGVFTAIMGGLLIYGRKNLNILEGVSIKGIWKKA